MASGQCVAVYFSMVSIILGLLIFLFFLLYVYLCLHCENGQCFCSLDIHKVSGHIQAATESTHNSFARIYSACSYNLCVQVDLLQFF